MNKKKKSTNISPYPDDVIDRYMIAPEFFCLWCGHGNGFCFFTDPEKQKVLRFAMQRPANYLTEIETYLEKALAEALEEEKTA